jgi:tetratricopeptide (TPR) repeat protein
MTVRFRRSMKIAPGVRINFNTHSTSLSLGPRGAHYTMSSTGRRTVSAGIPGTGLYAYETVNPKRASTTRQSKSAPQDLESFDGPVPKPALLASRYEKDFFTFLNDVYGATPPLDSKTIVAKAKELRDKHEELIYPLNLIAYFYIVNDDEYEDKVIEMGQHLWNDRERAFSDGIVLKYFKGIRPVTRITEGISATEILNQQQFGLFWAEVLQAHEKYTEALDVLHELSATQIVAVSMADIELAQKDYDAVFETTNEITNEDDATAILLVQRAIAFREKKLFDASLECLKQALAKKSRSQAMLNRAHLERALTYKAMNKPAQARKDLELVLVNEPANEEVQKLLTELKD